MKLKQPLSIGYFQTIVRNKTFVQFFTFGIFLTFAVLPTKAQSLSPYQAPPVSARLVPESRTVQPGKELTFAIVLSIDPGWYIYGPNADSAGIPTEVEWKLPKGFSLGILDWPDYSDSANSSYSGQVILLAQIQASEGLVEGELSTIGASVSWLACADQCIPGDAALEAEIQVSKETPQPDPEAAALISRGRAAPDSRALGSSGLGLFSAILLALAGGLLLNLMPCVFPVLSLKVLSIKKRAEDDKASPVLHASLFASGVIISLWILVGLLLALRSGGSALGWGFQLQDPVFVALMACLFFVIALNFFGVFEIGLSLAKLGAARGRSSKAGSFLSGAFAVLIATPCAAPFMGVAIGFALSAPAATAFAVFTALAIGFAAPVFAFSFLKKRKTSPKGPSRSLGRASELLRAALGFPMAASAAWMAGVLAKLSGSSAIVGLLWAFIALGLGAFIWRSFGAPDRSRRSRLAAGICAILLLAAGTAIAATQAGANRSRDTQPTTSLSSDPEDGWIAWTPEAEADLRAAGRIVFVDFTASWCLTCAANEAFTLSNPRVRARLAELDAAMLKADWTARDELIAARLASFGRAGVPLYVLYLPGAAPRVLPEALTPAIVLEALRDADRR